MKIEKYSRFLRLEKKKSHAIETIATFLTMGMLSSCNSFVRFVFTSRPDNAYTDICRIHRILRRSWVTTIYFDVTLFDVFLKMPSDKLFGIIYMTFPLLHELYYYIILLLLRVRIFSTICTNIQSPRSGKKIIVKKRKHIFVLFFLLI